MDENTVHVKTSEYKISLGAIFDFLLSKWKVIIISVVLGLAVGFCYSFLTKEETPVVNMENVNKAEVKNYADAVKSLEKGDFLVKLLSNGAYIGNVNYYIEAALSDVYIIFDYLNLLKENSQMWNEINLIYDNIYNVDELSKILCFSGKSLTGKEASESADNVIQGIITVTAFGNNEENCNRMLDVFDRYFKDIEVSVKEGFASSYKLKTKIKNVKKDLDFADSHINELKNNVQKIQGELNQDEIMYYKTEFLEESIDKSSSISFKMPVLMAFLFVFFICFVYTMKFIFNYKIKTASELSYLFGLNVIGVYKASADKKGIDGAVQRRSYKKDLVDNTEEYIVTSLKELKKMPVALLGNKNNKTIVKVMEDLAGLCSDLSYYGELQSDPDAIVTGHEQNGVILVVNLWNTSVDELNREIEIALAQNINVIGCIVIK